MTSCLLAAHHGAPLASQDKCEVLCALWQYMKAHKEMHPVITMSREGRAEEVNTSLHFGSAGNRRECWESLTPSASSHPHILEYRGKVPNRRERKSKERPHSVPARTQPLWVSGSHSLSVGVPGAFTVMLMGWRDSIVGRTLVLHKTNSVRSLVSDMIP